MWITPNQSTILAGEPYTGTDGTRYPVNFPKSEIGELTPVSLTTQPATTQYQSAVYNIVNGVQIWTVTDWTVEQIEAARLSTVPQQVTMRQARLALRAAGLLATVESAIAAMVGAEGDKARIEWEFSSEVRRTQPLVLAFMPILGLTALQIDDLFIVATAL